MQNRNQRRGQVHDPLINHQSHLRVKDLLEFFELLILQVELRFNLKETFNFADDLLCFVLLQVDNCHKPENVLLVLHANHRPDVRLVDHQVCHLSRLEAYSIQHAIDEVFH